MNQQLFPRAPRRLTDDDLADLRTALERDSIAVPEAGCLIWTRGWTSSGYGAIYYGPDRRWISAHRASFLVHFGPIPAGSFVCHRCDVRPCVHPNHLFLGTAQDNTDDMLSKGRQDFPAGQRHSHARLTDETVFAIRASGLHSTEVAEKYGIAECTASQILNRKSWTHLPPRADERPQPPRRVRRGESAATAKITAADAISIYTSTASATDVARLFGVSESLVRQIRRGRCWAHATGADPE